MLYCIHYTVYLSDYSIKEIYLLYCIHYPIKEIYLLYCIHYTVHLSDYSIMEIYLNCIHYTVYLSDYPIKEIYLYCIQCTKVTIPVLYLRNIATIYLLSKKKTTISSLLSLVKKFNIHLFFYLKLPLNKFKNSLFIMCELL